MLHSGLSSLAVPGFDAAADGRKKKICVIGAGASGIAAAKIVADHPDELELVVLEKGSQVGGLWVYTDHTHVDELNQPVHSSVYKYLRTNSPKEIMHFPDYPHFTDPEDRSCVSHETVLKYLTDYADHFGLKKFIKFHTLVEKVTPILGPRGWRTTSWRVQTRNILDNSTSEIICDGVMVSNGHLHEPRMPKIPGVETFPGLVIHSHAYRKPEDFAGQVVVILGASSSGTDIATEVCEHAKTVYLSHNKDRLEGTMPKNLKQVAGVVSADGDTLTLKDGSTVRADAFILCTGYKHTLPFIDEKSGVRVEDNLVSPLYKHLINIEHPSMCFMGVPALVIHFPNFYMQAQYYVSLMRGKAQPLPSRQDMKAEAAADVRGKLNRHAHEILDEQWDYNDELARLGHFEPLDPLYRDGFRVWHEHRVANQLTFKNGNLRFYRNGEIRVVDYRKEQLIDTYI